MAWAVTVPDELEMIVGEQLNLVVNFTNLIARGDVISLPVTTIQNASTNEFVPTAILGVPFVTGNVILNVTVSSTPLRPKTDYVLRFKCTATSGAGSKIVSAVLIIKIIY